MTHVISPRIRPKLVHFLGIIDKWTPIILSSGQDVSRLQSTRMKLVTTTKFLNSRNAHLFESPNITVITLARDILNAYSSFKNASSLLAQKIRDLRIDCSRMDNIIQFLDTEPLLSFVKPSGKYFINLAKKM
jgi:hypothetical protein